MFHLDQKSSVKLFKQGSTTFESKVKVLVCSLWHIQKAITSLSFNALRTQVTLKLLRPRSKTLRIARIHPVRSPAFILSSQHKSVHFFWLVPPLCDSLGSSWVKRGVILAPCYKLRWCHAPVFESLLSWLLFQVEQALDVHCLVIYVATYIFFSKSAHLKLWHRWKLRVIRTILWLIKVNFSGSMGCIAPKFYTRQCF